MEEVGKVDGLRSPWALVVVLRSGASSPAHWEVAERFGSLVESLLWVCGVHWSSDAGPRVPDRREA